LSRPTTLCGEKAPSGSNVHVWIDSENWDLGIPSSSGPVRLISPLCSTNTKWCQQLQLVRELKREFEEQETCVAVKMEEFDEIKEEYSEELKCLDDIKSKYD